MVWTYKANLRGARGPAGAPGADGLPGTGAVASDAAVASTITTAGTSQTKTALNNGYVSRSAARFSNSYRKRVACVLPYQHADAAAATAAFGNGLYPQAFVIDLVADEVLTISDTPQIVSVYRYSTGAYLNKCYSLGRTDLSESAVIRYEGGVRYLYTVSSKNSIAKFNITTHPTNLTTLAPTALITVDAANYLSFQGGYWTTGSTAPDRGVWDRRERGKFSRFDANFNQVGTVRFPSLLMGSNGAYSGNTLPKRQAMTEGPGFFAFGMGGGWNPTLTRTPYHHQGVRILTPSGVAIVDSLVAADTMISVLTAYGLSPTLIECEGVQVIDGRVYSFYATNKTADSSAVTSVSGLVILEEFSAAPDALDFSAGAVSFPVTDVRLSQSGSHPIEGDGKMHNPLTWEVLDTLPLICQYMLDVQQSRFSFYSSDGGVKDVNGAALATGKFVEIRNANNGRFIITLINTAVEIINVTFDGTSVWAQS